MKELVGVLILVCFIGGGLYIAKDFKTHKQRNKDLNKRIDDLNKHIDFLMDELELKESEISYWGRKYDSCKTSK